MKTFLFACLILLPVLVYSQEKPAYQLFDREGRPMEYSHMVQMASQSKVVLFGELHNNPIAHWLQLELTLELFEKAADKLVLGAEMFEADNQLIVDEYLSKLIAERNFKAEAKLWNNYDTDYRPLVEFARENSLPFIATNIPRRYAALVAREGFEALGLLPTQALQYMAPLPVAYDPELPGYKAMLEMGAMPAHVNENLPRAQAIKDATMAHFIIRNIRQDGIFIHFHGTYHSNNYEGIVWYLREADSTLTITTISCVEQAQVESLEQDHFGLADIILVVPANMTKTY